MGKNNEDGYTLLLTLVLIVIITGFIGTLSYLTLTQQTQVEKTDEKFLLSDITEMGIEYYRNRALEDYVKIANQVKNNVQDAISRSPELYNTEPKIRALELREEREGLNDLKTTIASYSNDLIPVEEPFLHFNLTAPPFEIASTNPSFFRYKFNVKGSNTDSSEVYGFTLIFPNKLINVSVTPNSSPGSEPSIDYSKTIPTPNFTPPANTENCNSDYTNKTCISNSKFIKNIDNSTVYYLGNTSTNNANHIEFNNSALIIDGNLDTKNLHDVQNVSIFVNGDTSIDQFDPTNVKLYSSGTISFNKHTTISGSIIRSLGAVNATKKGMTISNTHMVLEGVDNTIDPFNIINSSTVCIKDDSFLDALYIDSSSSVYILNTATRTGSNTDNSKSPLYVDDETFNENCYGVSTPSGEIGIDLESNLSITPESILDEVDYDTTN